MSQFLCPKPLLLWVLWTSASHVSETRTWVSHRNLALTSEQRRVEGAQGRGPWAHHPLSNGQGVVSLGLGAPPWEVALVSWVDLIGGYSPGKGVELLNTCFAPATHVYQAWAVCQVGWGGLTCRSRKLEASPRISETRSFVWWPHGAL